MQNELRMHGILCDTSKKSRGKNCIIVPLEGFEMKFVMVCEFVHSQFHWQKSILQHCDQTVY